MSASQTEVCLFYMIQDSSEAQGKVLYIKNYDMMLTVMTMMMKEGGGEKRRGRGRRKKKMTLQISLSSTNWQWQT